MPYATVMGIVKNSGTWAMAQVPEFFTMPITVA
jgi:hypothetical protein